jgi:hypothetical protein
LAVLICCFSACGGGDRPGADDWGPVWDRVTALIPAQDLAAESLSNEFCGQILAELRRSRGGLLPTPDLTIDDAVNLWMEIAEDAFFECPPQGEPIGSLAEAYAEMQRLEQEIDTVLRLERGS